MPTQPLDAPAPAAGGFGRPYDTVFADGDYLPAAQAAVSVHANALSYGTGTFEGMRAFWNGEHQQLYLLEAVAHYERLERSARILGLPLRWTAHELVEITAELLRRNQVDCDAYVRPILFLAGEVLTVRMHDIRAKLTIAVTPTPGDYIKGDGVRCMTSTWRRPCDDTMPIRAKITGSYVGPAMAKTEAIRAGFDEALMLTHDGYVAEATTSNILARYGRQWVTPPGTDNILEGITRRQVMELIAAQTGHPVLERRMHRSEVYVADEVLLCGTAATVVPVAEVDGRPIGAGVPGETTVNLRRDIRAIANRTDPRHPEWTTPVYPEGGPAGWRQP